MSVHLLITIIIITIIIIVPVTVVEAGYIAANVSSWEELRSVPGIVSSVNSFTGKERLTFGHQGGGVGAIQEYNIRVVPAPPPSTTSTTSTDTSSSSTDTNGMNGVTGSTSTSTSSGASSVGESEAAVVIIHMKGDLHVSNTNIRINFTGIPVTKIVRTKKLKQQFRDRFSTNSGALTTTSSNDDDVNNVFSHEHGHEPEEERFFVEYENKEVVFFFFFIDLFK